jgi:hypothetical protein
MRRASCLPQARRARAFSSGARPLRVPRAAAAAQVGDGPSGSGRGGGAAALEAVLTEALGLRGADAAAAAAALAAAGVAPGALAANADALRRRFKPGDAAALARHAPAALALDDLPGWMSFFEVGALSRGRRGRSQGVRGGDLGTSARLLRRRPPRRARPLSPRRGRPTTPCGAC